MKTHFKKILTLCLGLVLVFGLAGCASFSKPNTEKVDPKYQYVKDFEKLGLGMFIHYGLYSQVGKGE